MLNLLWGGIESNQVGTTEFVDLCRTVGAEPLICVNFESDGRQQYMKAKDSVRTADAKEAAAWVAYCNDPRNAEREAHGSAAPLGVRYWQLGNETSYDKNGFDLETAARKTIEFAKAMRAADPNIRLIAWGDSDWAGRMADVAGEHVHYLAFHHMFDPDSRERPVLRGELYRRDPGCDLGTADERVADARRQDPPRPRQPWRPSDSHRADRMSLHRFLDGIAATCCRHGRPACRTPAFSTIINATETCSRSPPPPISAEHAGRTTQ